MRETQYRVRRVGSSMRVLSHGSRRTQASNARAAAFSRKPVLSIRFGIQQLPCDASTAPAATVPLRTGDEVRTSSPIFAHNLPAHGADRSWAPKIHGRLRKDITTIAHILCLELSKTLKRSEPSSRGRTASSDEDTGHTASSQSS